MARHAGTSAGRFPADGRVRIVIEDVGPRVDDGRYAVKRTLGERVTAEADVFTDGHDAVSCVLLHRHDSRSEWQRVVMEPLGNDRWRAAFTVRELGRYWFTVVGWVDHLETWRRDLLKKHAAGQDLDLDLRRGAQLVEELAGRVPARDVPRLQELAAALLDDARDLDERVALAQAESLRELSVRHPEPDLTLRHEPPLPVEVDRERARFSTWYEFFPRSTSSAPGVHGTFADCEARLPYVAEMGFDVLYLPPIHSIGRAQRKGPNNSTTSGPGDPGSPWAIGASEGGHRDILPELGTPEDFRRLVARARELGIEIALDIAFQCSPDHPYAHEHPEWFLKRPDGTIQYAENPPKKYQDIYPFHFESAAWQPLWEELHGVVEHWAAQGVRIFRVDNPHTKPFAFWDWLIARVKSEHPDAIFLSEAFTRPKVMYRLAKGGFTQSYTYFTWRNTKHEIAEYFRQLTSPPVCNFLRPNLWPNTPDILPEYLQYGGRAAFVVRLVLHELERRSIKAVARAERRRQHEPREPGSEEYRDSEKYQLRHWALERPDSLRELLTRINRIRRENPALQSDRTLHFHRVDAESLIAYSKTADEDGSAILVVANLDPHHPQSGWLHLDLAALGIAEGQRFQAHDLLSGARFLWNGARNFVALDPAHSSAHVFRIRRRVRTERDFDYFL
jgi:starch synthase (maltosyl-transferring)